MKILLTAFDPFGGDDTNSSMMTLKAVRDEFDGIVVDKMIIPTVYKKSAECVLKKARENSYDAIVCLGQAGGRRAVTVETIAINYAFADLSDNEGTFYDGEKLVEDGENALFATLPVKQMVADAKAAGFEASLSVSAGAFVCNSLMYLLLNERCADKIGFVHLPYATEQGKDGFKMAVSDMAKCIEKMIGTIKKF